MEDREPTPSEARASLDQLIAQRAQRARETWRGTRESRARALAKLDAAILAERTRLAAARSADAKPGEDHVPC